MSERRQSPLPLFEVPPEPYQLDNLTGLPNRDWLMETLGQLAEQQPGNFSLLFVDVDGLKTVNDTKGHDAGNELIRSTGSIILNSVRSNDQVSSVTRLGGDEFIAVLPGLNTNEGLEIVRKRIRKNLNQDNIRASMGGRVHKAGESSTDLLKSADSLMYQDKQSRKEAIIRQLPRRKRAALKMAEILRAYVNLNDLR